MAFLKRGSWEMAHMLIWLFQRSNGIKGAVSKVKHSSWPRNCPELKLIESLWSQLRQWQRRECATWMAGLKKSRLSLEEHHAIIPSVAVQKHAETQETVWKDQGGQDQVSRLLWTG